MMSGIFPRSLYIWALCCALLGISPINSLAADPTIGTTGPTEVIRLACVGDSITAGAGVSDRNSKSYPALLGQWLGPKWDVANFGASGSTLLTKGNLPYRDRPHFKKSLAFKPDVAFIMLGTNDSKHGSPVNPKIADNWQYKADFADDYKALLAEFKKINPNIRIFLGLPVPAFSNSFGIDGVVIDKEIVPLVREVAAQSEASIIDLHSALKEPSLFKDGVHPNDAGARQLAATVYRALTGKEPPSDSNPSIATGGAPAHLPAPDLTPAPVSAAMMPAKKNFRIYLLMGQSNMAGRGNLRESASQENNLRVFALDSDNHWVVAKDPLHPKIGRTEPGVGPGMAFALEMLKADPEITIGLIPCAVGGSSLRSWVKGAKYYENAVSRAKGAAEAGVIDGVLWHQGESDTESQKSADSYEARLTKMFADLRADLNRPNLPIVVGQLGEFLALSPEKYPHAKTVSAAIRHIPTVVSNIGYADSAGLGHKGDSLHFSTEAARELGVRYAKAIQALQKQHVIDD